jgi:hypothetical protein
LLRERERERVSAREGFGRIRRCAKSKHSQWHLDLNCLGDEVLDLTEHWEVVLGLDVVWVGDHHAGDETAERGDTVSLADTELGEESAVIGTKTRSRHTTEVSMWVAPASRAA